MVVLGSCSWLGVIWQQCDLGPRLQCGIPTFDFLWRWHPPLTHTFFSLDLTWEQPLLQRNSGLLILYWWLISLPDHSSTISFCPYENLSLSLQCPLEMQPSAWSPRGWELSISCPCASLHFPPWSAANTVIIIQVSSLLLSLTKISLWVLMLKICLNFADFLPNISILQPF